MSAASAHFSWDSRFSACSSRVWYEFGATALSSEEARSAISRNTSDVMYKTSGSSGKSRFKASNVIVVVWSSLCFIAQRTVAIKDRYLSCLSATRAADFFKSGSASSHRPFVASSIPRSTGIAPGLADEAGAEFAGACARTGAHHRARPVRMHKTQRRHLDRVSVLPSGRGSRMPPTDLRPRHILHCVTRPHRSKKGRQSSSLLRNPVEELNRSEKMPLRERGHLTLWAMCKEKAGRKARCFRCVWKNLSRTITFAGSSMRLSTGWTWRVWDLNAPRQRRPVGLATIRATY